VFGKLRKATISFPMSVFLSAWSNLAPTGQIFMKFDMRIFRNLLRKFKFHLNLIQITCNLHEYFSKLMKIHDELFSECEIFQTNIVEKMTRHIVS